MIRLNVSEHQAIIRAINDCINADSAFFVRGNFKNCDTGEVTSWVITVHATKVDNEPSRDTVQYSFFSGFSSEYPVGTVNLVQC